MENNQEPIRIAQIIGKWLGGGVESVVMNYYRHIDRSKIQFDFICDEDSTNIPYEEIEKLGGKIVIIPSYSKAFNYHKELKKVLKDGNYKIVHSHISTMSVFSLFAAKCAGVSLVTTAFLIPILSIFSDNIFALAGWISLLISSPSPFNAAASCVLFPPGAAHKSSTRSFGFTSKYSAGAMALGSWM